MVGAIELSATSPVWIEDAQVYPDLAKRSVVVRTRIGNATGVPGHGALTLGVLEVPVAWGETGGAAQTEVPLGDRAQPGTNSIPPSKHS